MLPLRCSLSLLILSLVSAANADDPPSQDTSHGDALLTEYFERQVDEIEASTFAGIETLEDWEAKRGEYRRQLADMLGLDPMPPKTPLKPVVTGTIDHEEFTVEKLHFQSSPGLYVTGNLYIPKGLEKPAPTVLYVCGHARVKEGDVSYGNKVAYQHHAIWFARHGYVCLIIDTLQLGEIEGIHHGTYNKGMWWWQSRGYTSAGVEAWNCIRALDYLETRPEVDASRFGVTGRSGGGAYSWWIAALDERIKVAVPVAGICSLRNHLLGPFQTSPWSRGETHGHDGCIEGHCDCMYFINTYRWDFPMVAALVAPRPLLIANTDKDRIFPLDGVYDVYTKSQKIYDLYGATDKLGLQICEGPHKDTQQLRVHAFQWINRHLKGEEPLIDVPAEKLFTPQDLRVFDELPADQINTAIHDTFVPAATDPPLPSSETEWAAMREEWMTKLREHVFHGWPDEDNTPPLDVRELFSVEEHDVRLTAYEFTSEDPYRLKLFIRHGANFKLSDMQEAMVGVLDEAGWNLLMNEMHVSYPDHFPKPLPEVANNTRERNAKLPDGADSGLTKKPVAQVWITVRGVGPTAWTDHEKERTQIKRRFALLGQTLQGAQAWDIRRGLQAIRSLDGGKDVAMTVTGFPFGTLEGPLLAASLFEPPVARLLLSDLDIDPPTFLNAARNVPLSAMMAMASERSKLWTAYASKKDVGYLRRVSQQLKWPDDQIVIQAYEAE